MNFSKVSLIKWGLISALYSVALVSGYCYGKDTTTVSGDEQKVESLNHNVSILQQTIDSLSHHADSLMAVSDSLRTLRATAIAIADSDINKGNKDISQLLAGKHPQVGCTPGDTLQVVSLQDVEPLIKDYETLQVDYLNLKITDSKSLSNKDNIIAVKDSIIRDKDSIISDKNQIIGVKNDEIKKLKRKSLLEKLGAGALAVGAVVLLIVK